MVSVPTASSPAGVTAREFQRFTEFDAALSIEYDADASQALGKDYWRVLNGFKFYLDDPTEEKLVFVPAGYLTDGATVPRMFWSLLPPWGSYGQAAVVHDILCERLAISVHGINSTITRAQADSAFKQAMVSLKVPRWKRNVMYIAVRVFAKVAGANTTSTGNKKARYEADWAATHSQA